MKKLTVILLLLVSYIHVFARQPDSVLVKSERMYFFHYTDTAIHIKEISFDERNRIETRESLADRWDSSRYINKGLLYGYNEFRFRADCENDLSGNKIPLLYNDTDYSDYTFFAPGRYATVRWDKNSFREDREYRDKHFTVTNARKQKSIDSLNFALLYDLHSYFQERDYCKREGYTFNQEEEKYNTEGLVLPMKNGEYLLAAGYRKDTIYTPQRHNYNPLEMLYSRQLMNDTDTLQINGKYGLYTITGNEVIPPVYDSLKTEEILVRAFRNGRVDLINYMGETVRENLRFAYPVIYRYQILGNAGQMYFMDKQGNESDSYTHSFMSVDDQLFPLGLDIVLLPPKKPKYSKKKYKQYTWVNFVYPYDYQKFESLKRLRGMFSTPTQEDLNRLGIKGQPGSYEILRYKLDFEEYTIERYGLDRIEWYESNYRNQRDEMYGYEIEAYDIPSGYKDLKLISGKDEYYRSGDYRSLPSSWIIAKKNGKYGVFDVRENNKIILPFVYDNIEAKHTHFILKRKGLTAYYPISDTPRYKELHPFKWQLARFQLPDGKWGWLSKDGKEYIDNE